MKAIRIEKTGGPEVLTLADVAVPEPKPNEAVVQIAASGVNFIDVYFREGRYPVQLPVTLGQEGAGVVTAAGAEVRNVKIGDRVAYASVQGSYAEYAAVPAERLVIVPEGIELETAAALMLQGMTAHYLTHSTWPLRAGETAIVHAAAGGVGLLLVQLAKAIGARVIGTAGSQEKAQLARDAGADEMIVYTESDFESEAKRLAPGGVDVIYDGVGKSTFDADLNLLRPRGLVALFGASSGAVPPFDPIKLSQKGSLYLTRPTLGHYIAKREELEQRAGDLFAMVRDGKLKVRIHHEYALADAAQAHRDLEGRRTTGKLLLAAAAR
ncbi:MAG TPA: quinone oxidoreductase [Thermoanaerobaculia bacterium]|nr:quinone oxidoreductase [Thermoanaerobaculia bacterium]